MKGCQISTSDVLLHYFSSFRGTNQEACPFGWSGWPASTSNLPCWDSNHKWLHMGSMDGGGGPRSGPLTLVHKHFAYSASPQLSEVVIISKTQWEKSTIVIPVACGYNGNGNTEGAGLLFSTLQPEGACVADMRPEGSPRKTLIIPDVFLFASQLCRRNQEHSKFYE